MRGNGLARAMFRIKGHAGTLNCIFDEPPKEVSWAKVSKLLLACDVEVRSWHGDGTILTLGKSAEEIQRPNSLGCRTQTTTLRKIRSLLDREGVRP